MEEICGLERRDVLMLLIHEFTRPKMPVPPSVWLNIAAEFNTRTTPGVGEKSLTRLLQSSSARLTSNTDDGAWQESLRFTGDGMEATAGMIWFQLGSPVTRQRWLAAHSLRTAARLGRAEVLDAVVAKYRRRDAAPFQAPELPFFYQHAQLWLMIAMARIALEAPKCIALHVDFLQAVAFDSVDRHVLRRHFAVNALLTCADSGHVDLTESCLSELGLANRSIFPMKKRKGPNGSHSYSKRPKSAPKPTPELYLDYDFSKDDVAPLASLFGRPLWEVEDALIARMRKHDVDVDSMHDRRGRSRPGRDHYPRGIDPEYQTYGEQLAWHALFSAAGDMLAHYPVVRYDYDDEDPWGHWLSQQLLTHPGGFWLADGMDLQPLDTWVSLMVDGQSSRELTTDPKTVKALLGISDSVRDWLTIDGSWHSNDGVEIRVMSSLAPRCESAQLAMEVAAQTPFQAYLPQLEMNDDDGSAMKRHAPFIPWIVRKHAYARLDETDLLGAGGAVQRSRLSEDATVFANMQSVSSFDRTWVNTSGEAVLRAEAWIESGLNEECARDGSRLSCRTDVVRAYLEARDADLLWLVRLRRRDGGYGNQRTSYWHTTAVIRMSSSLEVTYYPGRSNELEVLKF